MARGYNIFGQPYGSPPQAATIKPPTSIYETPLPYFGGPRGRAHGGIVGGPGGDYVPSNVAPGYSLRPGGDYGPAGYYDIASYPDLPNVPNTSGFGLDPGLQNWLDTILQEQEIGQQFNIEQRDKAVNLLSDFGKTVESALPLNPYSDEMREAVLARSNDLITRTGQTAFNEALTNRIRRGFSAGGTTGQTAAGGIQADLLGQRIGAETKTLLDQAGFNQMSNLAREDLLKQITAGQAQIQAGNVVDPEAFANTLSNALGIQLSEENMEEFLAYIQTLEPGVLERIMQAAPAAGAAFFPGGPAAQFAFNIPNLLFGNQG